MRARKKKWAANEFSINTLLVEEPERYRGSWNHYFGNDNPLHVEIGCGKGRFITESAAANPDINYIAVERESQIIISGLRRAREAGVTNLRFILSDAEKLPLIFSECEIKRLFIHFCDPWPNRKKWAKRRLTHGNFLKIYEPVLDGGIFFKTDNRELFEFSLEQFALHNWAAENVTWDLHGGNHTDRNYLMTEYEERFYNEGVPIMKCEAYPPGFTAKRTGC